MKKGEFYRILLLFTIDDTPTYILKSS